MPKSIPRVSAPAVRVAPTGRPVRTRTGHGADAPEAPGPRAESCEAFNGAGSPARDMAPQPGPGSRPARAWEEEARVAAVQALQRREAAVGQGCPNRAESRGSASRFAIRSK